MFLEEWIERFAAGFFLAFEEDGDREGLVARLVRRDVVVPAVELVALSSLPLRVAEVSVRVGERFQPGSVMLSEPEMRVTTALSAADGARVEVGAEAVVDEPGGDYRRTSYDHYDWNRADERDERDERN